MTSGVVLDAEQCYRAIESRDGRFDGWFIAGITSTGIYCRPSCPAPVRPKRQNVRFFPTAAAAQASGFRSCKRCRPDASPGSPEWNMRDDLLARAVRLINEGEIDRSGVDGLAARLAISTRHLHRLTVEHLGASPIQLARAQRANLARILLETTAMPVTEVAWAAGFSSIRQFNDTVRSVYDRSPSELRRSRPRRTIAGTNTDPGAQKSPGVTVNVRLASRGETDHEWVLGFLDAHGADGLTATERGRHVSVLDLGHGPGLASVGVEDGVWTAGLTLTCLADLSQAIAVVRRMLDLDVDPEWVFGHLRQDADLEPLVRSPAGFRIPGTASPFAGAVAAIVGQQISVSGARTILGRIVQATGTEHPLDPTMRCFGSPDALAEADLAGLGLTNRRVDTIRSLAAAVASNRLPLGSDVERDPVVRHLLELPGIGPWTADVIRLRVLSDPDVWLASDLVIRNFLKSTGVQMENHRAWRPWRSYVTVALWAAARRSR